MECCVGVQIVTPFASGAAMKTCGSMAKCVTIGNRYSCSMTRSAEAPATSPHPNVHSRSTFVFASGSSGRTMDPARAAKPDRAPARPTGRRAAARRRRRTSAAAPLGRVLRLATTAATGSPKNFVSPVARIGRSANAGPNRAIGCGRSSATSTHATPGHLQRLTSIDCF